MTTYDELVGLIIVQENMQWQIGDGLLDVCGAPPLGKSNDQSYEVFRRLISDLEEHGITYDVTYLAKMRMASYKFPPETRVEGLSWSCHLYAGNPYMLKKIKDRAGPRKLTQRLVIELKNQIEEEEREAIPTRGSDLHALATSWSNQIHDLESEEIFFELGEEEKAMVAETLLNLVQRIVRLAHKINPNKSHIKAVGE